MPGDWIVFGTYNLGAKCLRNKITLVESMLAIKLMRRAMQTSKYTVSVKVCCIHVCFVQVTIWKLVWRSRRADAPRCALFPTDICSVIQEGEITVEKCPHRGASARWEHHTLSHGQNKHGHNNSAPSYRYMSMYIHMVSRGRTRPWFPIRGSGPATPWCHAATPSDSGPHLL